MFKTFLLLNDNLEEKVPHSAQAFPYVASRVEINQYYGNYVPWHWHQDVEWILVIQGRLHLSMNNHSYDLSEGEGAFINSNMLHYQEPLPGPPVITLNQLFDPQLISGSYKSIYDQKYVAPVLECKLLEAMPLRNSAPNQREILELVRTSYDAAEYREYGYEIAVRNALSSAWVLLCREAAPLLVSKSITTNHSEERIKKMILFIHDHYEEKISLSEIAASASVSERECLRCFQQVLKTSPFTYLLEYRTRMAARSLQDTDLTVTDIALSCGFTGASYFSKTFRRIMSCTPSEYRAQKRKVI